MGEENEGVRGGNTASDWITSAVAFRFIMQKPRGIMEWTRNRFSVCCEGK